VWCYTISLKVFKVV